MIVHRKLTSETDSGDTDSRVNSVTPIPRPMLGEPESPGGGADGSEAVKPPRSSGRSVPPLRQGLARGCLRMGLAQSTPLHLNLLTTSRATAITQLWHAVFAWCVSDAATMPQRTAAGMIARCPKPQMGLFGHPFNGGFTDAPRTLLVGGHLSAMHKLGTTHSVEASASIGDTPRKPCLNLVRNWGWSWSWGSHRTCRS